MEMYLSMNLNIFCLLNGLFTFCDFFGIITDTPLVMLLTCFKYKGTRRFVPLWGPPSSSCRGLVAFSLVGGPFGPSNLGNSFDNVPIVEYMEDLQGSQLDDLGWDNFDQY